MVTWNGWLSPYPIRPLFSAKILIGSSHWPTKLSGILFNKMNYPLRVQIFALGRVIVGASSFGSHIRCIKFCTPPGIMMLYTQRSTLEKSITVRLFCSFFFFFIVVFSFCIIFFFLWSNIWLLYRIDWFTFYKLHG